MPDSGAGIFIDRVLVTENIVDGKQYLFNCGKWFDGGQVDGKIERTIKASALFHLGLIPDDDKQTSEHLQAKRQGLADGRWEVRLRIGDSNGRGSKLSSFSITAYGTKDVSESILFDASPIASDPRTTLVQVTPFCSSKTERCRQISETLGSWSRFGSRSTRASESFISMMLNFSIWIRASRCASIAASGCVGKARRRITFNHFASWPLFEPASLHHPVLLQLIKHQR